MQKADNVFFNRGGVYDNLVNLLVMRSSQVFFFSNGLKLDGRSILHHSWFNEELKSMPEHSEAWLSPVKINKDGDIVIKTKSRWRCSGIRVTEERPN